MDIRIAYLVAIVIGVSLSSPILRNSEAVNEVIHRREDLIIQRLLESLPAVFKNKRRSLLKEEQELHAEVRELGTNIMTRDGETDNLAEDGFIGDRGCHHLSGDDGCHHILEDGTEVFIPG